MGWIDAIVGSAALEIVIVVVADWDGSAEEVAVIVAELADVVVGAVNVAQVSPAVRVTGGPKGGWHIGPPAEIIPTWAFPPAMFATLQVTAVFELPVTLATIPYCSPLAIVAVVGII